MKRFLKLICWIPWGFLVLIIGFALAAKLSLMPHSLYVQNLKYLFWGFWLAVCCVLPFTVHYLRTYAKSKLAEIVPQSDEHAIADYNKHFFKYLIGDSMPLLLSLIFVASTFIVTFESYLLIEKIYIMWIYIFFLSMFALLIKISPEDRVIKYHIGFIKILNAGILLFAFFAFSNPFHNSLLNTSGYIDEHVFSDAASSNGNGYDDLLKTQLLTFYRQPIHPGITGDYLKTFNTYNTHMRKGSLDDSLTPEKQLAGNKSIHALLVGNAFALLGEVDVPRTEKQKSMENLLDYLAGLVETGRIDSVKNDSIMPFKKRLLATIINRLENGPPGTVSTIRVKLKKLYCLLKNKTTINTTIIKQYLGEEAPPCTEN